MSKDNGVALILYGYGFLLPANHPDACSDDYF